MDRVSFVRFDRCEQFRVDGITFGSHESSQSLDAGALDELFGRRRMIYRSLSVKTEIRMSFVMTNSENSDPISRLNSENYLKGKALHEPSAKIVVC